mgnify:CR=1 FL=1
MTNIEKEYYKVLDSTYAPTEIKKEMIGGVYECYANYYHDKTIGLYTEDKSGYFIFNHSDVQKVFDPELKFNGEVIGKGDGVKFGHGSETFIVYDAFLYDGNWILCVHRIDDENNSFTFNSSYITAHTPLSKKEKYIELNGKKYRKEVEEVLKEYEVK